MTSDKSNLEEIYNQINQGNLKEAKTLLESTMQEDWGNFQPKMLLTYIISRMAEEENNKQESSE